MKERTLNQESSPPALHRLLLDLIAFHYAAREGSIQGGARKLGLNRNSLSRYLDELEETTGTRLRHVNSEVRGLDLTEAGFHLHSLLAPLLARLETVASQVSGGVQDLRLGCQTSTASYLLPGWMRNFASELTRSARDEAGPPRFSLRTGNSESILGALRGLEIDLGIIATENDTPPWTECIAFTPLFREKLLAICPRDHPLSTQKIIAAREFVRHPQYLYYRGGERYQERINALAPGEGASRRMEFDTIQAVKETVRAGLGVSIIPGGAVRPEDGEWLSVLRLEIPPPLESRLLRTIAAVTREGDELTPLARGFLQFLQAHRRELCHPSG